MMNWLWLIPVLPLLGALLNGVLLRGRVSKTGGHDDRLRLDRPRWRCW